MSEADEDLAKHDDAESRWRGAGSGVPNPVAEENKERSGEERKSWTAMMEGVYCRRRGDDEGEEESGAEPIDDARSGREVGRCRVGNWREG